MSKRQRRRILRPKGVTEKIDRSRVQIWRDVRAGRFPAPIQLGPNAIGWFEDEIDDWLASRPRVNWAAQPAPEAA